MACCMLGLLLVYQCIDAFARVRARLLAGRDSLRRGLVALGSPAGLARRLMRVSVIAFAAGLASAATVGHAAHLAREVHAVGGVATDWCRTLIPAAHAATQGLVP